VLFQVVHEGGAVALHLFRSRHRAERNFRKFLLQIRPKANAPHRHAAFHQGEGPDHDGAKGELKRIGNDI